MAKDLNGMFSRRINEPKDAFTVSGKNHATIRRKIKGGNLAGPEFDFKLSDSATGSGLP